jgi:signal transduction histidine kinase
MVAVDQLVGADSSQSLDISLQEARDALGDLEEGFAYLAETALIDNDIRAAYQAFTTASRELIGLIDDWQDAATHQAIPVAETFNTLRDELVELRQQLLNQVKTSDKILGQIGNIGRFLVAFLIPAAVILIYRELVRRQQRQSDLETRLDAERQINSAREQLIANASHELRTPLTSIMGLSMMLSENPTISDDAAALELVSIIVGESEDLARIVEDLLTVARLDAGALHYSFEDIEVHTELQEIAEGGQRAGIAVTAHSDIAVIRADRLRFRQILRNLLSNAKKYGGPQVTLTGQKDGRTYKITVTDNGPGIPQHLHERLFQRFIHQGNNVANKDSVGLGLSIVHSLAQDMGGSIRYHYNGQSHFTLRLPFTGTQATERFVQQHRHGTCRDRHSAGSRR